MSANELQPDVEEVLQVEPDGYEPTVKVSQQGPVRTQALPRKAGATFTKTLSSTAPQRLLGADHRRASALINAEDNIWIAYNKAGIQSALDNVDQNQAYRFLGSINPPFAVGATVEVWACAVTSTARVSVSTELWATGEGDE